MKPMIAVCCLFAALGSTATVSTAQPPIDDCANLNLYVVEADYSGCDTFQDADFATCGDLASAPPTGTDFFVWVVFSREGMTEDLDGIQFGILYDEAVEVTEWTLCTGSVEAPTPTWPASGAGNAVLWPGQCYSPPHEVAKAGYFTVAGSSTGAMQVIGDPRGGRALYADCPNHDVYMIPEGNLGGAMLPDGSTPTCGNQNCITIGVPETPGENPVQERSWGQIKSMF